MCAILHDEAEKYFIHTEIHIIHKVILVFEIQYGYGRVTHINKTKTTVNTRHIVSKELAEQSPFPSPRLPWPPLAPISEFCRICKKSSRKPSINNHLILCFLRYFVFLQLFRNPRLPSAVITKTKQILINESSEDLIVILHYHKVV